MKPKSILLDNPIIAGMVCLETSKKLLYRCHYGLIKEMNGNDCHLIMTDTDSLVYLVENHDTDRDMYENRRYFDMSNYPPDSPFFCDTNKRVRGRNIQT